ncbi:acyl-CoA dehydrogenase family protein [Nonomuraea sp. NPDC050153]|uniref:acyl-CoA dehydrogenase family protein n=1 Tax=Nonomuraea sp. NPDC050153 TaxID=3364359 RepID=UPI0037ACF89D
MTLSEIDELVMPVLRRTCDEVDRDARLPLEALAAIEDIGLFDQEPAVTRACEIAEALAKGCGATAMIWAMHQAQRASIVHHAGSGRQRELILELLRPFPGRAGRLVASVTSEVGTGGDIGRSVAQVEGSNGCLALRKRATTISYASIASTFLVSAGRSGESRPTDQVGVVLGSRQVTLTDATGWDTLGMRGTSSPGYTLTAEFENWQILPAPFAEIAAETMLPWSHLLWSAVWVGLATEALHRASRILRHNKTTDSRLAEAHGRLSVVRSLLYSAAKEVEQARQRGHGLSIPMTVRLNDLKVTSSTTCVRVALSALEICGMRGYAERSEFSVSRILRDLLSAPLMVSNRRLLEANSQFLAAGKVFVS